VRRVLAWGAVGAYAALIFVLSSQPDPLPMLTQNLWDKGIHFVEYGALGVLVAVAVRTSGASLRRAGILGALLASLYGASDEFHQWFVPGRDADPRDWLADTLGSAGGAAAAAVALRVRAPRASIRGSR
jgi:VanZ family protein